VAHIDYAGVSTDQRGSRGRGTGENISYLAIAGNTRNFFCGGMLPSFNCGFTAVGQDGVILDPEQGAQTIPENMVTLSPPVFLDLLKSARHLGLV
jgi:hypothetical protein